jgi:GDP-L-fucose synthase
MNILITGGNGYLAKSITKLLSDTYKIESVCRNDFDLTNTDATMKWFENKHYDVIVHTAIKGGSRLLNEDESVLENNIKMYMNLAQCTNSFSRLINVGSGAEFITPGSFYGLSKRVINNHIETQDNFFNLRIYAVFDENELESRFIKSNLYRYIAKQPVIIHQNKYMDFIYMQDFIKILDWFIRKNHLPKSIDCVYEKKYSLVVIANLIT